MPRSITAKSETDRPPVPPRKHWRRRVARPGVILLCLGISAASVIPFFFIAGQSGGDWRNPRMPVTHDMFLHFDQMKSFYEGLAAKEIYPRWEEDTNRGFGAPTTSYYPPGVYYITSAFYALFKDWVIALLDAHLLMMIASAAAIYLFARKFVSRAPAAVVMVAYAVWPYHVVDQYQREALAELMGFVWMPLILLFIENVFDATARNRSRTRWISGAMLGIAGLAICYGGFLWCHPPTAYQFTLALAVYVPSLAIIRRNWRGILLVTMAGAIALALSAAYLYPAAAEKDLIRHEFIAENWPYHESYVFTFGGEARYPEFNLLLNHIWILNAGVILGFCGVLAVYCLRRAASTNGKSVMEHPIRSTVEAQSGAHISESPAEHSDLPRPTYESFLDAPSALRKKRTAISPPHFNPISRLVLFTLTGGFISFMMTRLSYPLGKHIPMIDIGVFSWRMLAITSVFACLILGVAVDVALSRVRGTEISEAEPAAGIDLNRESPPFRVAWIQASRRARILFGTLSVLALTVAATLTVVGVVGPQIGADVFEPEPEHTNLAIIPRTAPGDPDGLPECGEAELDDDEGGTTAVETWQPQHRVITTDLTDENDLLVRTFNFPGWTAEVDGQPAEIQTGEELGDINLHLEAGQHRVVLDYLDTPIRRRANQISVWSCILVGGLILGGLITKLIRPGRQRRGQV